MRETDALDRYLDEERRHAFTWGRRNDDCMLFVAGWGFVVTGTDHGEDWRGRYADEAGAWRLIRERGGLEAVMDRAFGPFASVAPQRGDVGLYTWPEGQTGMICTGRMWACRHKMRGVSLARVAPQLHWPLGVPV